MTSLPAGKVCFLSIRKIVLLRGGVEDRFDILNLLSIQISNSYSPKGDILAGALAVASFWAFQV